MGGPLYNIIMRTWLEDSNGRTWKVMKSCVPGEHMGFCRGPNPERILSYLPLSHVAGLMVDIAFPVVASATTSIYATTFFARLATVVVWMDGAIDGWMDGWGGGVQESCAATAERTCRVQCSVDSWNAILPRQKNDASRIPANMFRATCRGATCQKHFRITLNLSTGAHHSCFTPFARVRTLRPMYPTGFYNAHPPSQSIQSPMAGSWIHQAASQVLWLEARHPERPAMCGPADCLPWSPTGLGEDRRPHEGAGCQEQGHEEGMRVVLSVEDWFVWMMCGWDMELCHFHVKANRTMWWEGWVGHFHIYHFILVYPTSHSTEVIPLGSIWEILEPSCSSKRAVVLRYGGSQQLIKHQAPWEGQIRKTWVLRL